MLRYYLCQLQHPHLENKHTCLWLYDLLHNVGVPDVQSRQVSLDSGSVFRMFSYRVLRIIKVNRGMTLRILKANCQTSLAIQWLRQSSFTPGVQVRSLVKELKSHMPWVTDKTQNKTLSLIVLYLVIPRAVSARLRLLPTCFQAKILGLKKLKNGQQHLTRDNLNTAKKHWRVLHQRLRGFSPLWPPSLLLLPIFPPLLSSAHFQNGSWSRKLDLVEEPSKYSQTDLQKTLCGVSLPISFYAT